MFIYKTVSDVEFLNLPTTVTRKLSLFPRKCRISGKTIWMKFAYRVRFSEIVRHWDREEHEQHTDRWYLEREYIMLRLKA